MKASPNLNNLPGPVLVLVGEFLTLESFINFKKSSKYMNKSLDTVVSWEKQFKYFLPPLIKDTINEYLGADPMTPEKTKFQQTFNIIKSVRNCLTELIVKKNPLLDRSDVIEFLKDEFYDIKKREALESKISLYHQAFPPDLYFLYRFLNGEDNLDPLTDGTLLFGGLSYSSFVFEFRFIEYQKPLWPFLEERGIQPFVVIPASYISLYGYDHYIQIDTRNIVGLGKGALTSLIRRVVKPDSGEYRFLIYVWRSGVLKFLEDIAKCSYEPRNDLLCHLDTINSPMIDVTKLGIRIRISAVFSPFDFSSGMEKFVYAYQTRVSANGAKGRWVLAERIWKTMDGDTEGVFKEDVLLGIHEIREGAGDFVYEASHALSSFYGSMTGQFTFINVETKEAISIELPTLQLNIPKGSALVEQNPLDFTFELVHQNPEN